MTTARWARVAGVSSAATMVLFVIALVVSRAATDGPRGSGPYTVPLRVVLVIAGVMVGAAMVWRYERLARGRFKGRPRWRVFTAWWALFVITALIVVTFPLSAWATAAWVAALLWAISATRAARLDRLAHP